MNSYEEQMCRYNAVLSASLNSWELSVISFHNASLGSYRVNSTATIDYSILWICLKKWNASRL
jgi:hypothetical protein